MPFNDPSFPMQFLVGRELAKRQNVDDSTATKFALAGAMISPGLLGLIIARQLAIRDAPAPVAGRALTGSPGTPAPASGSDIGQQVNRIIEQFQLLLAAHKKAEEEARAEAEKLSSHAARLLRDRTEVLRELCKNVGGLASEETGAAQGAAAGD